MLSIEGQHYHVELPTVVEMTGRVRYRIDMSRRVRNRINVIAMLVVVDVCFSMWNEVDVRRWLSIRCCGSEGLIRLTVTRVVPASLIRVCEVTLIRVIVLTLI